MTKFNEKKTYRLTNHLIDTTHLRLIVQGRCLNFGSDYPNEREMAIGTLRVIDTVLENGYNNRVTTLSKDDEKYLKNAIKIGRFRKATKKEIEDDFYITVNVA